MKKRFTAAFFVLLAAAAGCSGGGGTQQRATPAPPLHNPLDFALYPGATIVSSRSFTQVVKTPQNGSNEGVFSGGQGTYAGHEVFASTPASFASVAAWVQHLDAHPPQGYTLTDEASSSDAHAQAVKYGLDYATFRRTENGKTRGVLVLVMDPQRVNKRFGAILGLVAKYRSLPPMLRSPIDDQIKSRIGITGSEATQPDSPIGAALSALDQFEKKDARGIVVLDATKQ